MKTNLRFILAAVLLACIAALGFSHGVWAGPLMQGTVPTCPTTLTGSGKLTTCEATVDSLGGGVTVTDTALSETVYPLPPRSLNFGPAVDVTTNGNLVILCFPDIDTPPVGNIWYWLESAGKWVYWPSYHTSDGLTCTLTGTSGIYTIEY